MRQFVIELCAIPLRNELSYEYDFHAIIHNPLLRGCSFTQDFYVTVYALHKEFTHSMGINTLTASLKSLLIASQNFDR